MAITLANAPVSWGIYEFEGIEPKYPYARISEALAHCKRDNISLAQLAMANEVAITGHSEADVNAFLKEFRASGAFERLGDQYLAEEKKLLKEMGQPFILR